MDFGARCILSKKFSSAVLHSVTRCVILISDHHRRNSLTRFCRRIQLWGTQGGWGAVFRVFLAVAEVGKVKFWRSGKIYNTVMKIASDGNIDNFTSFFTDYGLF